jgi:hypothetical protein
VMWHQEVREAELQLNEEGRYKYKKLQNLP